MFKVCLGALVDKTHKENQEIDRIIHLLPQTKTTKE